MSSTASLFAPIMFAIRTTHAENSAQGGGERTSEQSQKAVKGEEAGKLP